jgi:serine/threonine protein kinase
VTFEATFQDENNLYFLMEYVERGELSDVIKNRSLPLNLVKHYIAEIVNALEHLHAKHIVHRDLKPQNILIT